MKLRIRGNSIRFRLTRSEVEQFRSDGQVEEKLVLGHNGDGLTYRLQVSGDRLTAKLEDNKLTVSVPEAAAREWTDSEQIGIESDVSSVPRILIEKDFACLTSRPGEDETDMFPDPLGRHVLRLT